MFEYMFPKKKKNIHVSTMKNILYYALNGVTLDIEDY